MLITSTQTRAGEEELHQEELHQEELQASRGIVIPPDSPTLTEIWSRDNSAQGARFQKNRPFTLLSLAAGFGLAAFTYSLEFTGRAPATNGRIVLLTLSLLCCLAAGGF